MKVSGEAWVLANLNISGYYRVNYDLSNWERLISLLGSNHEVKTPPGDPPALTRTRRTWTSSRCLSLSVQLVCFHVGPTTVISVVLMSSYTCGL